MAIKAKTKTRIETVLFPEFTEQKLSIRICNTRLPGASPKYVSASKDLKSVLVAKTSYTFLHVDKRTKSVIFSNRPVSPNGIRLDLMSATQEQLVSILKTLGFEQGVTYFGQQLTNGRTSKIIFKNSDLPRIIRQGKADLNSEGIEV